MNYLIGIMAGNILQHKQVVNNCFILITLLPNALYWLKAKDFDKEERIFTFENGKQIWW